MAVRTCPRCEKEIKGRFYNALGQSWHLKHFTCKKCDVPLENHPYLAHENNPYCKLCYMSLFQPSCKQCNQPMLGEGITACGSLFHPEHFICHKCKKLLDPKGYSERGEWPYCTVCAPPKKICTVCEKDIDENPPFGIRSKYYHMDCFMCYKCSKGLFFGMTEEGQPICMKCLKHGDRIPGSVVRMANRLDADGETAGTNNFEIDVAALIKEVEIRTELWNFRRSVGGDEAAQRAGWNNVYRALYPTFDMVSEEQQNAIGNYIEQKWIQLRETFLKSMVGVGKEDQQYIPMLQFLMKINAKSPDMQEKKPQEKKPQGMKDNGKDADGRVDDHGQFFESIMYEVRKFDDDQTLLFRGEVIKIIQMIKCAAAYSKAQPVNPYPDNYAQEYISPDYAAVAAPPPAQPPITQYDYQQHQPVPSLYTSRYFPQALQQCTQVNPPVGQVQTGYSTGPAQNEGPPFIIYTSDCGPREKRYVQCQDDCVSIDSDCNPFIGSSSDDC